MGGENLRDHGYTLRVRGGRAGVSAFPMAQGVLRPLRAKISVDVVYFFVVEVAAHFVSYNNRA